MAYCEILTKIDNKSERLKLSEPSVYEQKSDRTDCIVSDIVSEIVGDAVCEAENKAEINGQSFLTESTCQRSNVGDALDEQSSEKSFIQQSLSKDNNKDLKPKKSSTQQKLENPARGVGDQLVQNEEIIPLVETPSTSRHPIVEKKSRLTDLVKNSKQILSKFILTENLRTKSDEWEEKTEKVVTITELDCTKIGMEPFKVKKKISPENVPLPEDPDERDFAMIVSGMETIDLTRKSHTLTPQKDDKYQENPTADQKKTMTFPVCSAGSSKSLKNRFSTMKIHSKDFHLKKRKWSFGSKIINYIRKRSTKSKKEDDTDDAE